MNYLNITDPTEMHRAVDQRLRVDPDARYIADYTVDAQSMVNNPCPTQNHDAVRDDPWVRMIVESFGTLDLDGFDLRDPVIIYERDRLLNPVYYALDGDLPIAPAIEFCADCAEFGQVLPVRIPYSARVIEVLLCVGCVGRHKVAPS